jgi:uncharacterized membrane protein
MVLMTFTKLTLLFSDVALLEQTNPKRAENEKMNFKEFTKKFAPRLNFLSQLI